MIFVWILGRNLLAINLVSGSYSLSIGSARRVCSFLKFSFRSNQLESLKHQKQQQINKRKNRAFKILFFLQKVAVQPPLGVQCISSSSVAMRLLVIFVAQLYYLFLLPSHPQNNYFARCNSDWSSGFTPKTNPRGMVPPSSELPSMSIQPLRVVNYISLLERRSSSGASEPVPANHDLNSNVSGPILPSIFFPLPENCTRRIPLLLSLSTFFGCTLCLGLTNP